MNTENSVLRKAIKKENVGNYILSQKVQIPLNNNVCVLGGSVTERNLQFILPNLINCNSSFVCIDIGGELIEHSAKFLKSKGYQVRVLNFSNEDEMKKSARYNPFKYLKCNTDVSLLVSNIMTNTEGFREESLFEKCLAEKFLCALMFYIWYEGVEIKGILHKDFSSLMCLLKKNPDELEEVFDKLEEKEAHLREADSTRETHPALYFYNETRKVAFENIVKEIIITLNLRMEFLQKRAIVDFLSDKDEMNIEDIGLHKTVVYLVPENNAPCNFIIKMLCSQIFRTLYRQADSFHGRLPIHVSFMINDFPSMMIPDDFTCLLSTMKPYGISTCILMHGIEEFKASFGDAWGTVIAGFDSFVYLGRNSCTTYEYLMKLFKNELTDGNGRVVREEECAVFVRKGENNLILDEKSGMNESSFCSYSKSELKRMKTINTFTIGRVGAGKVFFNAKPIEGYMAQSNIKRWGNSHGIRLTKEMLTQMDLKENDSVEIHICDGKMTIEKVNKPKPADLKERLETFYKKPIDEIYVESIQEDGANDPAGEEIIPPD